jgi:hypothetical protein
MSGNGRLISCLSLGCLLLLFIPKSIQLRKNPQIQFAGVIPMDDSENCAEWLSSKQSI